MITLNLDLGNARNPIRVIGAFLKLLKDAARRHGWPTAHIWIREFGETLGDHVHILVHISSSAGNWLQRRMPRWIKRCGLTRAKGVSNTRRVVGRPVAGQVLPSIPERYNANIQEIVYYVLKHCSIDVTTHYGIRSKGPNPVAGKRIGISANIGPTAQAKCKACTNDRQRP